jgi:hypothetical protein
MVARLMSFSGNLVKEFKNNLAPIKWILLTWFISRLAAWQVFNPTLSPDSKEYIDIANALQSLQINDIEISRPFGYAFLIALFGAKPTLIVICQQFLSLGIAIDLFLILGRFGANKFWKALVPIGFLLYPLTFYLEFQALSEIFTAFLLVKVCKNLLTKTNKLNSRTNLKLLLLLALIALVRPNVLVFCFGLVFFPFSRYALHLVTISRLRKIFVILTSSLLLAAFINFSITGRVFPSSNTLTAGVAMHMLDAVPNYTNNSNLTKYIIEAEMNSRAISPGSKYWAIQEGSLKYTEAGFTNVDQELRKMNVSLVSQFPLLYLQSVFGAFFSSVYANVNAFLPLQSFPIPEILLNLLVIYGIFFQSLLFFLILTFKASRQRNFYVVNNLKRRLESLVMPMTFVIFLLVNAAASPIEQGRYLFPIIPVMFLSITREVKI